MRPQISTVLGEQNRQELDRIYRINRIGFGNSGILHNPVNPFFVPVRRRFGRLGSRPPSGLRVGDEVDFDQGVASGVVFAADDRSGAGRRTLGDDGKARVGLLASLN